MSNGQQEAAAVNAPEPSADASRNTPAAGFDAVFAPYRAGLREGRLRVQWCPECRSHQWPARSVCDECQRDGLEWTDVADPTGTVFSWTVVHHAKGTPFESAAPYAVALVELEKEQVRMFAHVSEYQGLSVGSRVTIDFDNLAVSRYPTWRLFDGGEHT